MTQSIETEVFVAETQVHERRDFSLVPNPGLRTCLETVEHSMDPKQEFFRKNYLPELLRGIKFGDSAIFDGNIYALTDKIIKQKVVPHDIRTDNGRPHISLNKEQALAVVAIAYQLEKASKLSPRVHWNEVVHDVKEMLGQDSLASMILPPDPNRKFPHEKSAEEPTQKTSTEVVTQTENKPAQHPELMTENKQIPPPARYINALSDSFLKKGTALTPERLDDLQKTISSSIGTTLSFKSISRDEALQCIYLGELNSRKFRDANDILDEIWGCNFVKILKADSDFLKQHPKVKTVPRGLKAYRIWLERIFPDYKTTVKI